MKYQRKMLFWALLAGLVVFAIGCAGCTSPQPVVVSGDTVKVFYTVMLSDETVFESNANGSPLEVTIGSGMLIPGFDEAVIGMSSGQTKTVSISPEKGYGVHRSDLVYEMDTATVSAVIQELQDSGNLYKFNRPGFNNTVSWQRPDGTLGYLTFSNITESTVTVDENHPLAGKMLTFEITLVEIVPPAGTGS
ncbi:MAG TPA: FKBP-type peptidyl-prolyl cis-trans isomerase [Methanoregulaceae archaeon]|nr:FKBP-type peptidyl-prolyl cis-trans isomerase [Methanoregulaceae archaeon]